MRKLNNELKNKIIDTNKLLAYGFIKENEKYLFKRKIYKDQFEIIVNILDNTMSSKLIDLETNDEYILVDIPNSKGEFVGKLREIYENQLEDIINNCTIINVFKNKQSKEVIKYIKEKYHDDLEFLWKKFDNNAIWRNKKNNKWYGILLIIPENKLNLDSNTIIEIIDLRYQKEFIKDIIDNKNIFPGYHMNKNSWITIKLDNSIKTEEIFKLIDNSYNISVTK